MALSAGGRLWSNGSVRFTEGFAPLPRCLLIALCLLLPVAAIAQDVPQDAERDLWCGTAFDLLVRDLPGDATLTEVAAADYFAEGGQRLIDRAIPIYLESGYSDPALATYRETLEGRIGRLFASGGRSLEDAPHSFEDCVALIGQ